MRTFFFLALTGVVSLATWAQTVTVREISAPLSPDLMAVAEQVHTGWLPCEKGTKVIMFENTQAPGRFSLQFNQHTYHLAPVVSVTGAVRLEDTAYGVTWVQVSNKSMLLNSKLGKRMADNCQSPAQKAVAEAMKTAPSFNLLEPYRALARQ